MPAATAPAPSVENVSILLTNAYGLDAAASEGAVQALKDCGKEFTLVAVGKLEDHDEGKIPYQFKDFGTADGVLPADAIFSRNEAMRMITETLQLNAGVGKALTFTEVYDVNATEAKLIKGLREAGYARPQEIDHMLRNGVAPGHPLLGRRQATMADSRVRSPPGRRARGHGEPGRPSHG